MKTRTALWLLGWLPVLGACTHAPPKPDAKVRAAVVVRDCLGSDRPSEGGTATVYATADALRLEVHCGRRPFHILYRNGDEKYVHYDLTTKDEQLFTTEQVREFLALQRAVARKSLENAEARTSGDAMNSLLAEAATATSPLRGAAFRPASIGETVNGVRCRRFDMTGENGTSGEACLARADALNLSASNFAPFATARDKFPGLMGTGFELFDPIRRIDGTDYVIVRLSFGDGRRGVVVPRLQSVAMREVSVKAFDAVSLRTSVLP